MSFIDWTILILFLSYTVWDGTRRASANHTMSDFFQSGRSMPWWAMGLSVMATQASAITFIGTTGQSYMHDMRFIQVYLGLPVAMVILCLTLVPYFYNGGAFTAYETLENRFGMKTRLLTSSLFLVSRSLALGTVIAAPSYVLALLLDLPLTTTILIIGLIATLYTMVGGITGVIMTDVKQMAVMVFGIVFAFGFIIYKLTYTLPFSDSLYVAGALNKLQNIDFSFDISEKYNIWSGLLAGLFLMLSYFGTDQTQVQRYLTARSLKDAQGSLLLSAFAKIPMQFIILLLGVMLYLFYIFNPAPASFRTGFANGEFQEIYAEHHEERRLNALKFASRRDKENYNALVKSDRQMNEIRHEIIQEEEKKLGSNRNDTNYIFPFFILNELPIGIIGLLIAGIFAAALSSIDSELNALSTVSIIDWYKRLQKNKTTELSDVRSSRLATLGFGMLATLSAVALGETRSIIELVNQIGSYFYGSILGVFILLYLFKKITSNGAFIGLLAGMVTVFFFDCLYSDGNRFALYLPAVFSSHQISEPGFAKSIEYLWLNPIGSVTVIGIGVIISFFETDSKNSVRVDDSK